MKKYISFILILVITISHAQKKIVEKSKIERSHQLINIITSAQNTPLRLTPTQTIAFTELKQPLETQICVFVQPKKTFQKFLGIGGAITDASAEVFGQLPVNKQQELLDAYYSREKGIGYSLIRTTMHSSDFSSASYTYIQEGDKELKTFDITHDKTYRIPLIKKAIRTAQNNIKLYVSPWSPPAFMKDNKNMLRGGKLLPEYQQSWANYYVKFIKSYEKEGIPIWGLTVQNEPMATQKWESCIYTADEERDFLKNYLGPTLQRAGMGNKKITVWDHNRDLITQRAAVMLDDPKASAYVWGIGYHWYEDWSGGEPMYQNIARVHEMYPNKNLLFTEGCAESFNPANYQKWANGERYGKSMIHDFNNGTVGWTDWNILLDEKGGPNHVGNFCFAPIHANLQTSELTYTPSYYFIGHFSKFILPDAQRISSTASRSQLLTTSFLNPDQKIVTIVMNQSDSEVMYFLCLDQKAAAVTIPAHGIQTLVY